MREHRQSQRRDEERQRATWHQRQAAPEEPVKPAQRQRHYTAAVARTEAAVRRSEVAVHRTEVAVRRTAVRRTVVRRTVARRSQVVVVAVLRQNRV